MADPATVTPLDFLRAIHGDQTSGFIETRILSDVERQSAIECAWLASPDALNVELPRLMALAESRNAGVFYGVLRRREHGQGKNEHTLPGRVLWVDMDFKDYPGGETEARQRLDKFAIKPSIIVRSAHGLHAYWLLSADLDPEQIRELNTALRDLLGADSVQDPARILRVPGTFNRKDPANPVRVEIEKFEPELRHDSRSIKIATAAATPPPSSKGPPKPPPTPSGKTHVAVMSELVQALVRNNRKISNYFFGQGKPKAGPKGGRLDTSGSGYDYSFLVALVQEGVTDPDELAAAVLCRPDGHARGKGQAYVDRTVANVLEKHAPRELDPYEQLQITKVNVFDSNPPVYEIVTQERSFRITADALSSSKKFRVEYLAATHTMPVLPPNDEWGQWVNLLLERAERREMPPEASTEPALREAIEDAIDDLPFTDEPAELMEGKAFDLGEGRKAFREGAVRNRVKKDFPNVGRQDVSRVLRELGYESGTHRVAEAVRRLWSRVAAK